MNECDCEGWRKNKPLLDLHVDFDQRNGSYYYKYSGELFRYCPWCGRRL